MKLKPTADSVAFLLRESVRAFLRHRGMEKASVLAYNSFFALFPLMLLLLFAAGRFMASSQAGMDAVNRLASQMIPMLGDVVIREVQGLATHNAWGLVSILLLVWGVTPLASAIRGAFDQIYVSDRAMPFVKEKMLDMLAVLLMLVLLIVLVVGEIAYAVVAALVAGLAGKIPLLVRVIDVIVPVMVTIMFLSVVHYVFAPRRPRLMPVLVGALVSAVLLALMGPVFTQVMRFNPNYGFAFGSLKAVFLLLVWVYSAFVVILLGIEVTVSIQRRDVLLVRDLLTSPTRVAATAKRLSRHMQIFEADQIVFREREEGDVMYYIVSGGVRLSRDGVVLKELGPGEYFGEMAMLLKAARTATATVTVNATRMVVVSADNLDDVMRQNPQVVWSLLREMARRLSQTDERVAK